VDAGGGVIIEPNTTSPSLIVRGADSGGGGLLQLYTSLPSASIVMNVDAFGSTTLSTISTATFPTLTVNDDGGGVNDIADFYDITGAYNVVEIGQPLSGNSALTVTGDQTGDPAFLVDESISNGAALVAVEGSEMDLVLDGGGSVSNGAINVSLVAEVTTYTVTGGLTNLQVYTHPGEAGTCSVDTVTGISSLTQAGAGVTGSITEMISVSGTILAAASTAVTETIGFYTQTEATTSGAITAAYGVYADAPTYTGGTIGTAYGIYVADQTIGNTFPQNYSIFVAGGPTVLAGVATAIVTKTSAYTATQSDHTINCNGNFTVTLPTTNIKIGQEFYIKNVGGGSNSVSCSAGIDGGTSVNINSRYSSVTVQWDGTQYWIY
jgi:hypothetical protein